jgi:glycolate oxidase FAD binding subunit
LGGVVACNMAGPRRVRAGAARDHFLGFSAVDGRGDFWKAGGRVVKNVTGYDMCKLQAGAFGTLSVLLEVTVRALPRPETSCSIVFSGLGEAEAIRLLAAALNSPHDVSAAAHLPPPAASRAGVDGPAGRGLTVLRLEGPRPSVAFRAGALLGLHESGVQWEAARSEALWAAIGSVQPLLADKNSVVWRVCAAPSSAPALLDAVRRQVPGADGFYDWGGGLLWIEFFGAVPDDAWACVVRGALGTGGHATLLRAEPHARAKTPVFQPQPAPLEALSSRVKSGFDPLNILNPGRMQQGLLF